MLQTGSWRNSMSALAVGSKAPEIELKTLEGKLVALREELASGPVVLVFFKVSCPTCQYALPFLERLHKAYGSNRVRLVGISQNNAKETAAFKQQFGVTFPVLLDDLDRYPASNAYGLTNVPSIFWVTQDGEIEISSVGWVKGDFERINQNMAEAGKTTSVNVFLPGEDVREFRAG